MPKYKFKFTDGRELTSHFSEENFFRVFYTDAEVSYLGALCMVFYFIKSHQPCIC